MVQLLLLIRMVLAEKGFLRSKNFMLCIVESHDFEKLAGVIDKSVRGTVAKMEEEAEFLIKDIIQSFDKWRKSPEGGFCYKYLASREIVGFILVKEFWNFSHLFVLPSYQGRGVGRSLVTLALAECREKSPHGKVVLNSSTNAARFYEAMGFKRTGPGIERPGGCIPYEYKF